MTQNRGATFMALRFCYAQRQNDDLDTAVWCFFLKKTIYTFVLPVIITGTVVATAVLFYSIQPFYGK